MLEQNIYSKGLSVGDLELELSEIKRLYEFNDSKSELESNAGTTFEIGGFLTILCC